MITEVNITSQDLLAEVLSYPSEWNLIPVKGKEPLLSKWQKVTVDRESLKDFLKLTGVGLVTGSGLLAIDIDGHSAEEMVVNLSGIPMDQALPDTVSWTSNKPGRYQLLYKVPDEYLCSWAKLATRRVPTGIKGEQLEFRYKGAQSVLPPSIHPETKEPYKWILGPDEVEVAFLPLWIINYLDKLLSSTPKPVEALKKTTTPLSGGGVVESLTHSDLVKSLESHLVTEGLSLPKDKYLSRALVDHFHSLAGLTDDRNNQANVAAFKLGQLVHMGLPEETIKSSLLLASNINGKILKDGGESRISATIDSGLKAGKDYPRSKALVNRATLGDFSNSDNMDTLDLAEILSASLEDSIVYNPREKSWYKYQTTHWQKVEVDEVNSVIHFGLRTLLRDPKMGKMKGPSVKMKNDVREHLKSILSSTNKKTNNHIISFQNGLLDLETGQFHPHNPCFFNTEVRLFSYDPTATCPKYLEFLDAAVGTEKGSIELIRAFNKATLKRMSYLQVYLEIVGQTRTGKSVQSAILKAIVGRENVKNTTLAKLENDRFMMVNMLNKPLIVISEGTSYHQKPDNFLSLLGQDSIQAETKYKSDSTESEYSGMVLVVGNKPLTAPDADKALESRRRTVYFVNQVAEGNRETLVDYDKDEQQYRGKFAMELPGIFNWIMGISDNRVSEVLRNPHKAIPGYGRNKNRAILETDKIAEFMDYNFCLQVGGVVPLDFIVEKYMEFCRHEGVEKPLGRNSLARSIKSFTTSHLLPYEYKKTEQGMAFVGLAYIGGAELLPGQSNLFPIGG